MELERKPSLLAKFDFSKWRKWNRINNSGNPPSSVHGFGNALQRVSAAPDNLAENTGKEKMVEIIYSGYGNLMS